jgi:hypothetical protein
MTVLLYFLFCYLQFFDLRMPTFMVFDEFAQGTVIWNFIRNCPATLVLWQHKMSRKTCRRDVVGIICVYTFCLPRLCDIGMCRQILLTCPNIRFYENQVSVLPPSSVSRAWDPLLQTQHLPVLFTFALCSWVGVFNSGRWSLSGSRVRGIRLRVNDIGTPKI